MGAKQSKRSVDISGKEAEGAGEVAAAGAGGEGRVEQLADADALKPQANGDAHPHHSPEKEKQLDSGTPENEKDATTEKEVKDQEETEKEKEAPVTNGETEHNADNGESTPSPDEGKKNKKEKVKKKWSLRSISFSRKDKPKQEKKQKDDEAKTNGEPEKVPEEVAETSPEAVEKEASNEIKTEVENKDEKTPETPVTEPITNGSSTPESPKTELPVAEEPKTEKEEGSRPEPKAEIIEPEQLPVNGLSLQDSKKDEPEIPVIDSNKTEEQKVETTETVPSSEIKTEVCVDPTPLIEPTPPPLPANPPPSCVASFAATTMAPEVSDASLANDVDIAKTAPAEDTSIPVENTILIEPDIAETKTDNTDPSTPLNDALNTEETDTNIPEENVTKDVITDNIANEEEAHNVPINTVKDQTAEIVKDVQELPVDNKPECHETVVSDPVDIAPEISEKQTTLESDISREMTTEVLKIEQDSGICESKEIETDTSVISQNELNPSLDAANDVESLKSKAKEIIDTVEVVVNGDTLTNGDRSPPEPLEESRSLDESVKAVVASEDSMPPSLSEPAPPSDLCPTESELSAPASPEPQEQLSDKMAELITEVPTIPESINTETSTEVAVANE